MKLSNTFFINLLFISCIANASSEKVLTTDGFGDLRFGSPLKLVNNILHNKIVPPPISLRANSNCYYVPVEDITGMYFVFINDKLERIDISLPNIVTEDGILVGSGQDVAEKKIQGMIKIPLDHVPDGELLIKENKNHRNTISYQIYNRVVNRIVAGDKNVIRWSEGCE